MPNPARGEQCTIHAKRGTQQTVMPCKSRGCDAALRHRPAAPGHLVTRGPRHRVMGVTLRLLSRHRRVRSAPVMRRGLLGRPGTLARDHGVPPAGESTDASRRRSPMPMNHVPGEAAGMKVAAGTLASVLKQARIRR